MNKTVKENLTLGEAYTRERLLEVLKQVELFDFIQSLPKGLNTLMGEAGSNWSGGQLQSLAIAQALLRDKGILLLDEPTSKLDPKTTQAVERTLLKLKNVTVLMITHHLNEANKNLFDEILDLNNLTANLRE